jgi:TRAP-type mannitol/chloroaromatic compound transport system substrate-binding protein
MKRRDFVKTAGLASAGGLVAACGKQPASNQACGEHDGASAEPIEWKMVTTWPRDFPGLGTGAGRLAEMIGQITNGRLTVKVYGGNELVPAFEVFDAVSRGTAEMGHGAAYYWKGKIPAVQIIGNFPFGLTGTELNGWYYYGGGMELYREAYEPSGIVPFVAGNSGTQMAGWFNREINSIDDLVGLKMRIPGAGGEVLKRAGGSPLTIPGAELFTALQTGTIDATEWVGPLNDLAFGLFRAAEYYYYPGWHEPGSALEALVNKQAFDALTPDLQAAVEVAAQAVTADMQAEFTARNGIALKQLVDDHGVDVRPLPDEVIERLKELSKEVLEEIAAGDELSGRVYASMMRYAETTKPWTDISERYIVNRR